MGYISVRSMLGCPSQVAGRNDCCYASVRLANIMRDLCRGAPFCAHQEHTLRPSRWLPLKHGFCVEQLEACLLLALHVRAVSIDERYGKFIRRTARIIT